MAKKDYKKEFFKAKKLIPDVSLREIAKKMDLTQTTFSNYTTGRSRCPFSVVRLMCYMYDIPWSKVCKEAPDKIEDKDQINIFEDFT